MLQPSDRQHLFESLRPPDGYSLDYAIGTTFTLELLALLTAPLAFTTFDWADEDGHLTRSPQALLATMQQYAERITIFCQTGKIAIPKNHSLLYSYLENSVIEVNAPHPGGIFHPKIWVLRFTASNQPVLYRFLCLSRNLTFDRCWDTILLLDGQLINNGKEIVENRPLSNFIATLPQLAHNPPIRQQVQDYIDKIQSDLLRVKFELPIGFEQLKFHPLGLPGNTKSPFSGRIDRLLVMSPFVSEKKLNQLSQQGKHNILISRPEQLDQILPTTLCTFSQLYQINPAANVGENDDNQATSTSLVGLHAKLYIADAGTSARIWTGSANATEAAFERNVEFLVEMVGKQQNFGIDSLLAIHDKEVTFRSLLETFVPSTEPIEPDPSKLLIDELVQSTVNTLLKLHFQAHVKTTENSGYYALELQVSTKEGLKFASDIFVRCYPMGCIGLAQNFDIHTKNIVKFSPLSCQAITSFFVFEIYLTNGQRLDSVMFNVPLAEVPAERQQQILKALLQDKNQVLKLLMFLLADSKADARELIAAIVGGTSNDKIKSNSSNKSSTSTSFLFPVFEAMVKALDQNPQKLDYVARLVEDLRKLPPEEQLLPDNFDEIWQPIYTAYQKLKL
ncbi:phospholipase D family protein [Nostoc sp. FACHB-152]|nr:phospholipase D family protein [Nostoc sp. FACHB-152]